MQEDDAGALPIDQRAERAIAAARAAGTTAAALDALVDLLGCIDSADGRAATPGEPAPWRRHVAAAGAMLLELGLSGLRAPSPNASAVLAELHQACSGIDVIIYAQEALDDVGRCLAPWLARAEQLVSAALAGGQLSLAELTAGGLPLIHTCKTAADPFPELAARLEALWTRWCDAMAGQPVVRDARALRGLVCARGWRYPEVVSRARGLADRHGAPVAIVMDWILGSAPIPFGPSDGSETRDGRNGYAHSALDAVEAALAALELGPRDTFYDLGAGVGVPCIVAALRTEAACRGVEFHAGYVERARANARELGLARVEFALGDVATFDWADGDKFYMFNPFPDEVLETVAARLRALAARKPIRIACLHNRLPDGFRPIGGGGAVTVYEASADTVRAPDRATSRR